MLEETRAPGENSQRHSRRRRHVHAVSSKLGKAAPDGVGDGAAHRRATSRATFSLPRLLILPPVPQDPLQRQPILFGDDGVPQL